MRPLQVYVEELPSKVRLTLVGEVDVLTLDEFRSALEFAADHGGDIELHLGEVVFMDSMGLGAVMTAWQRLPAGRALTIVEASPAVTRLFGISSLSSMFGMPVPAG